jgi:hypothetical protein
MKPIAYRHAQANPTLACAYIRELMNYGNEEPLFFSSESPGLISVKLPAGKSRDAANRIVARLRRKLGHSGRAWSTGKFSRDVTWCLSSSRCISFSWDEDDGSFIKLEDDGDLQ